MLEGNLFYNEDDDKWILKTDKKDLDISSLIYGMSDLGSFFPEFDGEGERVKFTFDVL